MNIVYSSLECSFHIYAGHYLTQLPKPIWRISTCTWIGMVTFFHATYIESKREKEEEERYEGGHCLGPFPGQNNMKSRRQ